MDTQLHGVLWLESWWPLSCSWSENHSATASILFSKSAQTVDHRLFSGENACDLLGIDQIAIGLDLKDASHGFDQVRVFLQLSIDFLRQTDGTGEISSTAAVFNSDFHFLVSSKRCLTRQDLQVFSLGTERPAFFSGRTASSLLP